MKNIILLLVIVTLFGSSCTKEDPNSDKNYIEWINKISEGEKSVYIKDPIVYKDLIIYPLKSNEEISGKLVAYYKLTGKKAWEWKKAFDDYGVNGFGTKSYIYENILICGWSNLSYGIDLNTGNTLWEKKGDIYNVSYFCGHENLAYSQDSSGDDIRYIKETNVLDGSFRHIWNFSKTDEYNVYMGLPYPIQWEGNSYVTVITGKWIPGGEEIYWLNLYDLTNDKLAWTSDTIPLQIPLSGIPGLRPQFNEGKILLANDAIYSYNITDGSLAWRADYGNTFVLNSHITAVDGKVWGNNDSGFCVALDVHTGEELFNVDTGGSTTRIIYHENKIYIGSATSFVDGLNYLLVLDATTGQLLKQLEAPYRRENWEWHFNRNMEIDPETGLLYTGDHRYAMCIDPWK